MRNLTKLGSTVFALFLSTNLLANDVAEQEVEIIEGKSVAGISLDLDLDEAKKLASENKARIVVSGSYGEIWAIYVYGEAKTSRGLSTLEGSEYLSAAKLKELYPEGRVTSIGGQTKLTVPSIGYDFERVVECYAGSCRTLISHKIYPARN